MGDGFYNEIVALRRIPGALVKGCKTVDDINDVAYIEANTHGKLTKSDIDYVEIPKSIADSNQKIINKLTKLGANIHIIDDYRKIGG